MGQDSSFDKLKDYI